MATAPGTGRSNSALFALFIGLLLIGGAALAVISGVDLLRTGEQLVGSLYPPIAVTSQGQEIRNLYTIVFLIAVVIFFVVEGLIVWSVIRYRRRPGDDTLPVQTHGNAIAEIVWTVVPTLIVAFLFVISWQTLNSVESVAAGPEQKIRAVAGQFQWTFEYLPPEWEPGSGAEPVYTEFLPTGEDGGMAVPAGRTVQLYLDSPDVIHAFYVPQFLFKRDVVPGRTNTFQFNVNESDAGQTFRGQCAELCGSGHRLMLFDVHAMTGTEFDAWLAAKVAQAASTPPPPPSGGPAPSGAPAAGGAVLHVVAKDIAFQPTTLTASADTPFKIDFDNQDAGVPHNVAIHEGSPTGPSVFEGEIFPGVDKRVYDVPPLSAGAYGFVCTVHPNMTGTLTVE